MLPTVKDLIDLLRAGWPVSLAVAFASVGVLTADHYQMSYLSLLPAWLPGAGFVGFIASASLLLVALVQGVGRMMAAPFARKRRLQNQERHVEGLNDISDPEKWLLAWAVANNTQVFAGDYFNEQVKALLARGYLSLAFGGAHYPSETPLRVPDHIWAVLKKELQSHEIKGLIGARPFSRW